MLVIQRSRRKSASLVEAQADAHRRSRRCLSCVVEGKAGGSRSVAEEKNSAAGEFELSQESREIFLQGRSVTLQHRLSSKKQIPRASKSSALSRDGGTSECFEFSSPRRENAVKHARRTKADNEVKIRSVSRSSFIEAEYRKTFLKQRKLKTRTPLLMNTMNLPNENLVTSKEASQGHLNRDDAQATLERLLAARNPQSPSTSGSKQYSSASDTQSSRPEGEKSAYLQDSYDYLYQRHLQNLNNVIHNYNQQDINDSSQNSQRRKKKVDIYQSCCGGGVCTNEEPEAHENEENCARVSDSSPKHGARSDDRYPSCSVHCKSDKSVASPQNSKVVHKDGNSNLLTTESSGGESVNVKAIGTCDVANAKTSSRPKNSKSVMECQNARVSSVESRKDSRCSTSNADGKRNAGFLCINVSNQFQDIELEEVQEIEPAATKPVITLNHVSEDFSSEVHEVAIGRSRSRSPTPLLEVPAGTSLDQETLRPPLQ